ncbi:hypothetical protein [Motiliproteus sediminis]|uniref:hypothetical protein n=1 Tax=Motiliproteus sediminis TaxID=1468178 RepID=UPI001AEFB949|nr:hypothetical protein [Motiliproteus sediminis]
MIIKQFEERGLLLNIAFVQEAGKPDTLGFRGRLALVEAEAGDSAGNRKTPGIVMEQTILLSQGDHLKLLAGSLDRLQDLPALVEMYHDALTPETLAIIYVVNATTPMQVEFNGCNFALIPMQEGVVWNELMDVAGLDKADLKKKGSGEKVMILFNGLGSYKAKGEPLSFDQALTHTADIKRVERGAL